MKFSFGRKKQQGAALVMALLILLIMTVLGVSALSTSSLDMRIVGNLKERVTAYHVAESALELTLRKIDTDGVAAYEQAILADNKTNSDSSLAQTNETIWANTTAGISIENTGEGGFAFGSSVPKFKTMRFAVTGTAKRTGSNTQAVHQRGIELLIPGT